jgi:hypothetical protein
MFVLVLWFSSCVEPFETITESSLHTIVVDAMLTDEDIPQKISILTSSTKSETAYNEAIPNLKVAVLVNGKESISLTDNGEGVYSFPPTFRAKAGNSYQLFFQKKDGTKYQSNEQVIPNTPSIDKIYDEFQPNGIQKGLTKIPANYLYIDFKDSADEQNYYTWTWTLWERQFVCHTEYSVDYYCSQNCWEILHNENLNIFSDIYSNGKPVFGKLIAQIPYYQASGSLIEVKQIAIPAEGYRFLKILSEQTEKTGTLVDTPPAAIIGNIRNFTNPKELIAGFFMVGSANTIKYWLNRENAKGKASPVGLLGRKTNPNLFNSTFACIEGPNRTPIKPRGWID